MTITVTVLVLVILCMAQCIRIRNRKIDALWEEIGDLEGQLHDWRTGAVP